MLNVYLPVEVVRPVHIRVMLTGLSDIKKRMTHIRFDPLDTIPDQTQHRRYMKKHSRFVKVGELTADDRAW